jgi:hypothetical protein
MRGKLTEGLNKRIALTVGKFSALLGICLLFPAMGSAENCPYLNAATAGGLLGGNVIMAVTHPAASDTTCKFALNAEHARLEIAVHTMTTIDDEFKHILAQCGGTPTPLKAIGNEAFECTRNDEAGEVAEQIVGRVRERAFILSWTMPGSKRAQYQDQIQPRIRNVAEQVAGSLF